MILAVLGTYFAGDCTFESRGFQNPSAQEHLRRVRLWDLEGDQATEHLQGPLVLPRTTALAESPHFSDGENHHTGMLNSHARLQSTFQPMTDYIYDSEDYRKIRIEWTPYHLVILQLWQQYGATHYLCFHGDADISALTA